MTFKNKLESNVFLTFFKGLTYNIEMNITDDFGLYLKYREMYCNEGRIVLFKNAPKRYGKNTHTEMVIVGGGLDVRIDCKYQLNTGSIQFNSIVGEMVKNTQLNDLYEKELMFLYDGEGFNFEEMMTLKILNKNNERVKILSIKEFDVYLKNNLK